MAKAQARTKQIMDITQQKAMSAAAAPRRHGRTVGPTTCNAVRFSVGMLVCGGACSFL